MVSKLAKQKKNRKIEFSKENNAWILQEEFPDGKICKDQIIKSEKIAKDWVAGKTGNGNCYQIAAHMMFTWNKSTSPTLCHGIVRGQGPLEGSSFGHGWIEYEAILNGDKNSPVKLTMVIDHSNGKKLEIPQAIYYKIGSIKTVRKYTKEQTRKNLLKSLHYGPWD
jgi:hypothetical protein